MLPALVVPIIRRAQHKKLHAQGTGRHAVEESMAIGAADIAALAELLGDKPFMFGAEPRVINCTMSGLLEAVLGFPLDTPSRTRGLHHADLTAFRRRIRERWWPDLPALQT